MRYVMLIYLDETAQAEISPAEQQQTLSDYWAFNDETQAKGLYEAGEPLEPTPTATTVRVRDGRTMTTDGPFAETKEQLGGFYILECKDLDEALEYAAKIPTARNGSIEVRPIMQLPSRSGPAGDDRTTAT